MMEVGNIDAPRLVQALELVVAVWVGSLGKGGGRGEAEPSGENGASAERHWLFPPREVFA
jgi:hypothetical protein